LETTIGRKTIEEYHSEYMKGHNTVSLATEKDGLPHPATVFYVNIGFDLYFLSIHSRRHGRNFFYNPRV